MKRCPNCRKVYSDETLNFCLDDGAVLGAAPDEQPTVQFSSMEHTHAASPTSLGLVDGKSIAVLPFLNVSADPENEFFCDGLAEELLSSLAKIDGLKVASRTSSFSFKGKGAKIADIAAVLG